MNVTPLVDVVLVLLIIFMVITPLLSKHFWVHTPKQEKQEVEQATPDPDPPLVLRVAAGQGDHGKRDGRRVRGAGRAPQAHVRRARGTTSCFSTPRTRWPTDTRSR
jgi:hypothetical protein